MSDASADREICLQQVCPPGSAAAVAMRFVPGPARDRVLATEALLRSMRDIPVTVSDPAVALAKLAWWGTELQKPPGQSQHPARRLLDSSGTPVDVAAWQASLAGLGSVMTEPAFDDFDALQQWLLVTGRHEAGLLCRWPSGQPAPGDALGRLGAANLLCGKIGQLRSLKPGQSRPEWLPMALLARFQLSATELANAPGEAAARLLGFLCTQALEGIGAGLAALDTWPRSAGDAAGLRFVATRASVQAGLLRRVARHPARASAATIRPLDVWRAWRQARRLL